MAFSYTFAMALRFKASYERVEQQQKEYFLFVKFIALW